MRWPVIIRICHVIPPFVLRRARLPFVLRRAFTVRGRLPFVLRRARSARLEGQVSAATVLRDGRCAPSSGRTENQVPNLNETQTNEGDKDKLQNTYKKTI